MTLYFYSIVLVVCAVAFLVGIGFLWGWLPVVLFIAWFAVSLVVGVCVGKFIERGQQ